MSDAPGEETRELYNFGTLQPAMEILNRIRIAARGEAMVVHRIILGCITDERGSDLFTAVPAPVMGQIVRLPQLAVLPTLANEILEAPPAVRNLVFANLVAIAVDSQRNRKDS
jgi:hypothetical protein